MRKIPSIARRAHCARSPSPRRSARSPTASPDGGEHPYVGELLFFVPDAADPRFDDPGGWFTCTGTLMSSTIVVTAGHCTFGVGLNGESTTDDGADTDAAHGGVGGNDVWISFAAAPNFDILPPSSTFARDQDRRATPAWTATP